MIMETILRQSSHVNGLETNKYLKYIVGNDCCLLLYFFFTNIIFNSIHALHALTRKFKSILREAIIEKVCKMRVRSSNACIF